MGILQVMGIFAVKLGTVIAVKLGAVIAVKAINIRSSTQIKSLGNGYSSGDGHLCGEARDEGHCHPERRVTVLRGP